MTALADDSVHLTPRQIEVAALVADGLTDKQIGARLDMHYNTVRVHIVALAYRLKLPTDQNTRVLIARWWWAGIASHGADVARASDGPRAA